MSMHVFCGGFPAKNDFGRFVLGRRKADFCKACFKIYKIDTLSHRSVIKCPCFQSSRNFGRSFGGLQRFSEIQTNSIFSTVNLRNFLEVGEISDHTVAGSQ